jgi:cysteamine dioxygenase
MAAIQKLYEVCKVSLSEKGPSSLEAVENVHDVLGKKYILYFFSKRGSP